jgi:tetratricopeptide (TPR) repeat protein
MDRNKKNEIIRRVLIAVLILLTALAIVFYIVDITVNNTPPTENLFRAIATILICIGGLIRICAKGGRRRSLNFYESQYLKEIGSAFKNEPILKKKLLRAVRLYNENNFNKALKYLSFLKPVCKTKEDVHAVGLFIGLTLTDMDYTKDAVEIYHQMIEMNAVSSTVYGNLGNLYFSMGDHDSAISYLRLAIQNDEKNPAPYHNLASMYFNNFDFENAKEYAKKALEINHKFRQSAALLAIIYSLENDSANAEKYSHIAVVSGENPARLNNAIAYYKSAKPENNTDETDFDDEDDE